MSAFFLFSQANRQTIKEENPEASFGELVSWLFHVWGVLVCFLCVLVVGGACIVVVVEFSRIAMTRGVWPCLREFVSAHSLLSRRLPSIAIASREPFTCKSAAKFSSVECGCWHYTRRIQYVFYVSAVCRASFLHRLHNTTLYLLMGKI